MNDENPQNTVVPFNLKAYNLRRCPFCGGDDMQMVEALSGTEKVYKIQCKHCHFGGLYQRDKIIAALDWNARDWWHPPKQKDGSIVDDSVGKKYKCEPCPYCGGVNHWMIRSETDVVKIQCADCRHSGRWCKSGKAAVKDWNERSKNNGK